MVKIWTLCPNLGHEAWNFSNTELRKFVTWVHALNSGHLQDGDGEARTGRVSRLLAGADVVGVQDLVRHLDVRVPVAEPHHVGQLRLAQLKQLPPVVLLPSETKLPMRRRVCTSSCNSCSKTCHRQMTASLTAGRELRRLDQSTPPACSKLAAGIFPGPKLRRKG